MRFKNVPFALLIALLVGCSGGNTDAGDQDYTAETYTSEDAGAIKLDLVESNVNVGASTGFWVTVTDAAGSPVPNIRISCDTEAGLSLVEPLAGVEATNSSGRMSGVVGCSRPGSYQIGCRLPVGGNKRQFATVICGGTVPPGFDGFEGAAGGGLGGGALVPEEGGRGGDESAQVRLTQISSVNGANSEASDLVDIYRTANCNAGDTDAEIETEPFSVEFIRFAVINDGLGFVRFNRYAVEISDVSGDGRAGSTGILNLTNEVEAQSGESVTVDALYLDVIGLTGVAGLDGIKTLPNRSTVLSPGFKSVTITLYGVDSLGAEVQVTGSKTLSFGNYNEC